MLLLASWLTSGSINSQELIPGQIYNTQNLTNSSTSPSNTTGTWQNIGLWNQGLPCWQPGGPVYCGPKPYFNNGSFNFSYGSTDVYQVSSIANALPNTGTGLLVNGYNFGFTAKNGNGWDNGMVDQLTAYVHFNDPKNAVAYNKTYNLNFKFDWSTFNYSETFTTPFASKDLSTVTYGFIGKDNNGWAGPYGPEIYNVNFSIKYSVDPCIKDPLYSPTCPGYLSALNKLTGSSTVVTGSTESVPMTVTVAPTSEYQAGAVSADLLSKVLDNNKTANAVSSDLLSKILDSNKTLSAASAASITAATNLNDKSSITAFALSVIAKNAAMEKSLQEKAVSESLAAANAAATAAVEQSQSIAASQNQASINSANRLPGAAVASSAPLPGVNTIPAAPLPGANNANAIQGPALSNNTTMQTGIALLPPATPTTESNNSSAPIATNNRSSATPNISTAPVVTTATTSFELLPPIPVAPMVENPAQGLNIGITSTPFASSSFVSPAPVIDVPKFGEVESNRNIDMSSPTDFVAGYLNTKHNMNDMQTTVNMPAVNSKAQDNDAAGSVSIASIAKMPPGYDLYTSLTLKDVNFYKPEELYKGQKAVDNLRLLRGLTGASDKVHQEMVDEQYKNK